jgi:PAS domain S-box-containing protein
VRAEPLLAAAGGGDLLADELRAVLDGVADAITVQTPDQRLVYANEAAARLYGLPRAGGLAGFSTERYLRGFDVTTEDGGPLDPERLPGRLALAGRDAAAVTVRARDRGTGQLHWARIKATTVRGADGGVRFAINLIEDLTDLKRSEEAQRFLAAASRRLAGSLDHERTVAAVFDLAVPALADRCRLRLDGERAPTSLAPGRIVVPVPGRTPGALELEADEPRYDEHDLRTAEDFGVRAGAALDSARLYGAASEIARVLQTSLLPPHLPDVPGAALAAAYRPAWDGLQVGGDFYDVFTTGEGQWYLVIGDVCGKGAEAAAVTALARYTLRSAAARRRSPAALLRWVGDAMLRQDAARGRFCTIACAHVDLLRSPARVTVACGGHPLPLVRRADGRVDELGVPGTLLGLALTLSLQDRTAELHPGDTVVLYTDGLTEARAPRVMWGPAELAAAVAAAPAASPAALVDGLVAAALPAGATPRDDLAVLALRLTS